MPSVDVVDAQRHKIRTLQLDDAVFGVKENGPLVHAAVVMQRASSRQGTASTLRRGEVSGSGKKPWKQKHTGRARAGSIRSPVWRHGGTVFGPKPRRYAYSMPKAQYRGALKSALSAKLAEGAILVVADLVLPEPKTKVLAKLLAQLGLKGTVLILIGEGQGGLEQAGRNLDSVRLVTPDRLSVYDVLSHQHIVMPERVVARVQEAWA